MLEMPAQPVAEVTGHANGRAEARAERAAGRVGVQAAEVERLPFDLSVLEDEGVFLVRRVTGR